MNYKRAIIVGLLIVALLVWMASFALADDNASAPVVPAVTLGDLGVTSTGLLPSNPFYFSEEWMRTFQRIFTTSPLDKSRLEMGILNTKAAELLTTSEITPIDGSALSTAVNNYSNELQTMTADVNSLDSTNPGTDKLLSDLSAKLFMHYEVLEGIKAANGDNNGSISYAENQIYSIFSSMPAIMSDNSQFGSMLSGAIGSQNDDLGLGLRSLGFVSALEETNGMSPMRSQLDWVKQDQALKFEGRFDADGMSSSEIPALLGQLPVTDLSKVMIVEALRDFVVDPALQSDLGALRDSLVSQASGNGNILTTDVSSMINYAGRMAGKAGSVTQPGDKSLVAINVLISKANSDLANGHYGSAFGEASDAASLADNILFSYDHSSANSSDNISSLSDQASALEGEAATQGISASADPKLFDLFGTITSLLSGKTSVSDVYRVEEYINEINFALNAAQNGLPSYLIPVPGEVGQSTIDEKSLSTTSSSGEPQYCPEAYVPVCGKDSSTYTNKCFAGLVGVGISYKGECRPASTTTPALTGQTSGASN